MAVRMYFLAYLLLYLHITLSFNSPAPTKRTSRSVHPASPERMFRSIGMPPNDSACHEHALARALRRCGKGNDHGEALSAKINRGIRKRAEALWGRACAEAHEVFLTCGGHERRLCRKHMSEAHV